MQTGTSLPFAGKVALLTGSTRGLGRNTADWFVRDGAGVVITGREESAVYDVVTEIRSAGGEAWGIAADLAKPEEAHRLALEALELVPQLDILVNNAGMSIRGNFWEVSDLDWETQVNVNFRSSYILAQHAARQMIARGIQGRIINTSTIGARACHTNAAVYDSSKGAIETMTRNMAFELGRHGITVNCVVPGAIADRPGVSVDPAKLEPYVRHIPVGRIGRADDISSAIRFLCLPESSFISGESLLISGTHDTYLPEF